jgi:Flp pilus assembly protein TadD
VRLAPSSADALIDRGSVYRRRGNLDQAFADNARALELDPKNSNAYL